MDRRRFLASSFAASVAASALGRYPGDALGEISPASLEALPAELREKLMRDPFRPQFHLLPRANWMNDPCAPRFHRGLYHMFFQYNPNAAVWGDMHWNHATSPDLIHWKHEPVAIAPTPGSFDAFGIFTGSVLPGMEVPTVLYTGVSKSAEETIRGEGLREVQCLATSTDPDLRTWKKLDKPVLASPPEGVKVTGFRDPCPWKDGETWYLGVGSGFNGVGGAVLLYRSTDGRNWEYLHPLAQGKWREGTTGNPVDTGEMWECPDFFPLGGKHVLLYSTERKVYWEVGTFGKADLKFHSETQGLLDHGYYYAMKSMLDEKGRRILWGWVEENRTEAELRAAGWAGSMALPRVLTLGADNRLRMEVPPEFSVLRAKTETLHLPQTADSLPAALGKLGIQDRAAEVVFTFEPGVNAFAFELHSEIESAPFFSISYDGVKSKSAVSIGDKTLSLSPDRNGISTVILWMDGSIIEVFIDDREAMTGRNFTPSRGEIRLAWSGAAEALKSLTVSQITPISKDRLTS
jgi:beta-fructofuranosidase